MAKLPYRELQRRLKILETVVGEINRTGKKSELQKTYDKILEEWPGVDDLVNLDESDPEPFREEEPDPEPADCSKGFCEKKPAKNCDVCGAPMSLVDNWWHCQSCKNKQFRY